MDNDIYDKDYFESGLPLGISGYLTYSWLPEMSMRMAHKLIVNLPINDGDMVLDYGCAKGFLVKALSLLDVDCEGVDVSTYAILKADSEVRDNCRIISGTSDSEIYRKKYNWMIAKDVFEHIDQDSLSMLLELSSQHIQNMFVAVPLAENDECGKYIIPSYDQDITHIIAKSKSWWHEFFEKHNWDVREYSSSFPGMKENWTESWPEGNGFYILRSRTYEPEF